MNTETKVGMFAFAGLFLLGLAIFLLGDFTLTKEYPIYVRFADVAGLPDKSNVRLSGVEVGRIKGIEIQEDGVLLAVAIKDGVKIYRDAKFLIGSTSIIGSKFLQIDQGTAKSGLIAAGAHINGAESKPLDKMLTDTMGSLQKLLDDVGQKGNLGRELNATMINVRELTAKLNDLVASLEPQMKSTMKNVDSLTSKLDSLIAKADSLMDKVNSGKGAVGALLTDEKLKENVQQTVSNVKEATGKMNDVLGRMGGFKVYWIYENRQEPQASASRSDFGLKLSPRQGRYYYLGVANLANTKDKPRGPDYAEKNKIDMKLGWEGQGYDFYAGLLHGAGGVGIKYSPLRAKPWDRFSLTAEGSDFLRNRTIRGRKFSSPQYDLGAQFKINRLLSVGVKSADIAETGYMQYTASIKFEDKDIAYLLGLVSLGTMRSGGSD